MRDVTEGAALIDRLALRTPIALIGVLGSGRTGMCVDFLLACDELFPLQNTPFSPPPPTNASTRFNMMAATGPDIGAPTRLMTMGSLGEIPQHHTHPACRNVLLHRLSDQPHRPSCLVTTAVAQAVHCGCT